MTGDVASIAIPALGGALGGAATVAISLGKWGFETRKSAQESLRLLKGSDEIDGDGVIEIVQDNRRISRANRAAIKQSDAVPSPRKYE
ncbi:MAG: hypothetical protein U5K70_04350 [Halodesulfurarchaeum sp.]|nr:hypothetical protein [Halodesulfurarchaeum sp.]